MEKVLDIRNLTKKYEGFTLNDITLSIPGGTILGLIGENGAGKSTLIKCILGVVHPDGGEVTALGTDIESAKGDIGIVLDEGLFHAQLKPYQVEKVMAGLYPTWDRELFYHYLEKFGLPEKKAVKEFSRGMKMKLSIASALAHRPKLLLLDEATGGLDPVVRDEILEEFMDFVSDEDHGILISSHITSDLEKVCDCVAYLHGGELCLHGGKDELLETHGRIACTLEQLDFISPALLLGRRVSKFGAEAVVKDRTAFKLAHPEIPVDPVSLEDLMIFSQKEG